MVSQIEYDYLKAVAEEELRDAQEPKMDQDTQKPNPPILTHPEPNEAPSRRHEPVDAQEDALLKAALWVIENQNWGGSDQMIGIPAGGIRMLIDAYHAYDTPKPKQYTMPEWEVFKKGREIETSEGPLKSMADLNGSILSMDIYNALREATAIEE